MADFSQGSKFNKEAAFSSVKFGGDSYILEVELNEMQEIMRERIRSIFRNYFGDGVFGTGNMTYDINTKVFSVTNENAIVDGEIIFINTLTKSDINEGDSIYLEVWDEEATYQSVLKKWGNIQETDTVSNYMLDPRVLEETSRRMVICNTLSTNNFNSNHRYIKLAHIEEGFVEIDAVSIGGMVQRSGDQMQGILKAKDNTEYTTAQVRNIILSPSAPTDADGKNGDIWLQYE